MSCFPLRVHWRGDHYGFWETKQITYWEIVQASPKEDNSNGSNPFGPTIRTIAAQLAFAFYPVFTAAVLGLRAWLNLTPAAETKRPPRDLPGPRADRRAPVPPGPSAIQAEYKHRSPRRERHLVHCNCHRTRPAL